MKRATIALGVLAIAACTVQAPGEGGAGVPTPPSASEDPIVKPEWDAIDRTNDTCGMAAFQKYLGEPASSIPEAELPERARILAPGTMATMDYWEGRLNILTTPEGTIIGFKCG